MEFHGCLDRLTAVNAPKSKYYTQGRFGRLFASLPPLAPDRPDVRKRLMELGKAGGVMDVGSGDPEHPSGLPAGLTFLGQFIDHDVTFDPTSDIESQNDPEAIQNFRTPSLELDSVYASGPGPTPHLYDRHSPGDAKEMLVDDRWPDDLPRNSQNRALIGDPRNDENLIINQLHLAFLKFHNRVLDKLRHEKRTHENTLFAETQRVVRWHYQWIVVHEFLPAIVASSLVDNILKYGRKIYHWDNEPFMPVEFSVAAYRFGHTMVRAAYRVNDRFTAPIFQAGAEEPDADDPNDLRGGVRPSSPNRFRRFVEWDRFFSFAESNVPVQRSARFDTKLASPLFSLQGLEEGSLAGRNLVRGLAFSLPAGQDVARHIGADELSPEDLSDVAHLEFHRRTPLWFYILREADVVTNGMRLGPVGGRIVAEVLLGLIEGDSNSYLRRQPNWTPTELGTRGRFSMSDLLRIAEVRLGSTT